MQPFKQCFSGFNKPELNKHRKGQLKKLSQKLKEVMQCMKFAGGDKQWVEMRIGILKLTAVVEDYAGYIRSKNMPVKRIQSTSRSDFEKEKKSFSLTTLL